MRVVFVMVGVLVWLAAAGADQRTEPSQHSAIELPAPIARVLRDYESAWRARDARVLSRLFADDRVVMPNACAPVKGRLEVERCYSGSGGPLSLRALAFGTDGALGYIIGEYAEREGDRALGRFTLVVLKSADERWLIISDMDRSYAKPARSPEVL